MKKFNENNGITLLALIITIIVLVILAGVAINTLYGENGIISNAQDVATLNNIKTLEEAIELYKIDQNIEGKVEEESYPIALNEDGSRITLSQMKNASELAKLPDEVKYTLLNLTAEKGTTNIPSLDNIDYSKFYRLDYTKLNMSEEEVENLVIYIDGNTYKVINLAGVKYKKNDIYVIIPLNNESEPEYITVANNTYKLYGDGTLKVLGEKTTNSGYTSSEVNAINNSWDEFDLKAINARFDNRMSLPETLTSDWYAGHVYFSTGTAYVIDDNKDLWAWGANDYNKLGLGHSFLVTEPTKILEGRCEGKDNVKAKKVWAGDYNTFVIDTNGILWVCGLNTYGTLGQDNRDIYKNWVQIDYVNGNNIKEIQVSTKSQYSTALIIMNNGEVYGCGCNLGQLGNNFKGNKYIKIDGYSNAKQVIISRESAYFIDQDNNLYGCGYKNGFGKNSNVTIENPLKIAENVKQMAENYDYLTYITFDNKLYLKNSVGSIISISNAKINDNTILYTNLSFITDNTFYLINTTNGNAVINLNNKVKPYYNKYDQKEEILIKCMKMLEIDGKNYIWSHPNVTKITEKSNYNLRKVFENAIFVQGRGKYIGIVDRDGKIYESVTSNDNNKIENAKKIISSNASKYVIKNDGTLWARGSNTGMWGENASKNDYVQITKDGINNFTNVKNIYTTANGNTAIFTTEDNKIYWAGMDSSIALPQAKGDIFTPGRGYFTSYSKEVNSKVIEEIRNKIKDISYSDISTGGITGNNTLILTEDGKLYTMSTNKNMSGNNTTTNNYSGDFNELTIKDGVIVKQILTQDGFSLALLSNGEVYGWGYNTYGILGPGYEVGGIYPTPVKLEGLPANIRYMSLGNGFAIFASKSGEVYGIGKNDYGQLGTGDSAGRTEFVRCTRLEE